MSFPTVTFADWRNQVERDLGGRSFEKALVTAVAEGVAIQPLYTEVPVGADDRRDLGGRSFGICMRHPAGAAAGDLAADLADGADALWCRLDDALAAVASSEITGAPGGLGWICDADDPADVAVGKLPAGGSLVLGLDPIGRRASGDAPFATLADDLAALGRLAGEIAAQRPDARVAVVSTLPYHDAGADAVDELAIALATGVAYLDALLAAGLTTDAAAARIGLRVAVGRDTFVELAKLRALRICWAKLLAAAGTTPPPRPLVHAVCSSRTLTVRDPWVNLLRTTTQVFAAVLGGADLVTPNAFDEAFGAPSAHARRIARNTALVLREESRLGRVADPAGGAYFVEALTDDLARAAWERFRAIERGGGIVAALTSGRLRARIDASWHAHAERIARRKTPILGVSEVANLDEQLPRPLPIGGGPADADPTEEPAAPILPRRRDAAAFEALRARAESLANAPEARLVVLGPPGEARARVGFARDLFAAGGIRCHEASDDQPGPLVCLCGSDARYAAEAATRAAALRAAGAGRILLAGRPGELEPALRAAGVDGFLHLGCDTVALLSDLLRSFHEVQA